MCGMTRAFVSLFHGDISRAFYFHPLWPVAIIVLIAWVLYSFKILKLSKKAYDLVCYALSVLIIVCFILRHIQNSPVVQIHFTSSLLWKLLSFFRKIF
ncbi:MAG: DUF2752 domain-containing protein [Lachnospiraceae bacterium]|nr:DUF2752 domain-containing protein [Lachnospiraceae bacterium]